MRHNFPRITAFVVLCFLLGGLARQPAVAQRLDTLMLRSTADVIVPYYEIRLNGLLFYLADDGQTGYELWRTDGTPAGTRRVKDIRPGKASSFVSDSSNSVFADINLSTGQYVISASKVRQALRDFRPFAHQNRLYFWADDGVSGIELWRTDGTESGTQRVVDIIPGSFDSGLQTDILYAGGGRFPSRFVRNGTKLLFWCEGVANYFWEQDAATGAMRAYNVQTNPYQIVQPERVQVVNGRVFVHTLQVANGKKFCSLLETSWETPQVLVMNQSGTGLLNVLSADASGVLYSLQTDDSRSQVTTLYRRTVNGQIKLVRTFTIAKPTLANTRAQSLVLTGWAGPFALLTLTDLALSSGKGYQELWRVDTRTDSTLLMKRYDQELNVGKLVRGSQVLHETIETPNGTLIVQANADSLVTVANRFAVSTVDGTTGRLSVLADSLSHYAYQPIGNSGKRAFLTRRRSTTLVQAWLTDGRIRQPLADLGDTEIPVYLAKTETGLIAPCYVPVRINRQVVGYKAEVWRIDSTSTGTVRIGQAKQLSGGVGQIVSSGGVTYGIVGTQLLRLSTPNPDSIRVVASAIALNSLFNTSQLPDAETVHISVLNGKILARRRYGTTATIIAFDPGAPPRQCLITMVSQKAPSVVDTRNNVLGYCPQKDSVIVFRRQNPGYGSTGVGEITHIYYKTVQWLRDSSLLKSGLPDSIRLSRQYGNYRISVKGLADGCVATDSWQVYNDVPRVSILTQNSHAGTSRVIETNLLAQVTGGMPIVSANSGQSVYSGNWSLTATNGTARTLLSQQDISTTGAASYPTFVKAGEIGTYSLRVTDATGCTAIGTVVLDQSLKQITVDAQVVDNRTAVCAGMPIAFVATASGGKSPYTARWLYRGETVSAMTGFSPVITATSNKIGMEVDEKPYMLEVTDAAGRKVASRLLKVAVYPALVALLVTSSGIPSATRAVTLTAGSSNYANPTFTWALNGKAITGSSGKSLTATSGGVYSVTVGSGTSQNCQAMLTLTLAGGSGREAIIAVIPAANLFNAEAGDLTIMPNPAEGVRRIRLALPRATPVSGAVFTIDGRPIRAWNSENQSAIYETELDLSGQPSGLYILRLEAEGKVYTGKVIQR